MQPPAQGVGSQGPGQSPFQGRWGDRAGEGSCTECQGPSACGLPQEGSLTLSHPDTARARGLRAQALGPRRASRGAAPWQLVAGGRWQVSGPPEEELARCWELRHVCVGWFEAESILIIKHTDD